MNGFDLSTISSVYVGSTQYSSIYLGSTLLWPVNQSLPYDAELEYLESTGYPYIDTGLYNDSSTIIDMKMSAVGKDRLNGGEYSSSYRYKWGANGDGYVYYGFGGSNYTSSVLFDINSPCTFYLKQGQQYVKDVNGNTLLSSSDTFSTFSQYPIKLFRCTSGSNLINLNGNGQLRIYYCNITNSITQMELIPVRVGNVGYMYDKISGQLFENKGSGSFVLGPDKDVPNDYTRLQYISSTNEGNLYIDLNIKLYETLNTDYDIAMKFNISSTNTESLATMFACLDSDTNPWPGTFIRKSNSNVVSRYIGGTAKDNTIGQLENDIELSVLTPPNKNVTNLNNSNSTHLYGTSLFCTFSGGTNTPARYCNARLYYFKLFVDGVLVRDMIPCIDPNNVVGLYDLRNRTFYSSPNGNAFIAGPAAIPDYVTDGLIFWLDGINKGTGSSWTDLIGGLLFSTVGSGCTSTSNSWSFPGSASSYLTYTGSLDSIGGSNDFTIEVCYNNLSNSPMTYVFGCGHGVTSKYPLYYHDGTYITWIQGGYMYNASTMTGNAKYTVSLNNDSGLVNGLVILKTSSTDYWDANNSDFRIGSASNGGAANNPMNGDIYSIRIYNRKLSQSEQLQNQIVDNQRFNLGLSIQ